MAKIPERREPIVLSKEEFESRLAEQRSLTLEDLNKIAEEKGVTLDQEDKEMILNLLKILNSERFIQNFLLADHSDEMIGLLRLHVSRIPISKNQDNGRIVTPLLDLMTMFSGK